MTSAIESIKRATIGSRYEGQLWLVGGAVRDELMGRTRSPDVDIVLQGSSEELAFFLLDQGVSRTAPVIYTRFATALVLIDGEQVEIATARRESYVEDSRKPEVEAATLEEDACRRDFTVNALLKNIHTGEIYDPLGLGRSDIEARLLRTPLDPRQTFFDDPLRMLRAVRFKWQLGFRYVPGLQEAIRDEAERLRIISEERIRDEFVKMLRLQDADRALEELRNLHLLRQFAPELEAMKDVEQGSYHHLDVWDHSLLVLRNAGNGDLTLSLAALLHDVGKPSTRFVDPQGNTRFFGHEHVGADMARQILRRLKFPNDQIEPVAKLVRNHMRLGSAPEFTPAAARRLMRDLGDDLERLLLLVDADAKALRVGIRQLDLGPIRRRIEEVAKATPREQLESPLSGDEIMRITGLSPGAAVGRLKAMLVDKVLEGELLPGDRETATEIVRRAIE